MGQAALIASLALAVTVAVFAVQNASPVALRFGVWSVETSLVVVILVSAVTGAVAASLVGLPGWFRDRRRLRRQARELQALKAQPHLPPPAPEPAPEPAPPPAPPASPSP
jgi:uncharacterized integral membrane protein